MMSLRERNRRQAMRLTQRTALPLFIDHGFDAVTVGDIAEQVGMAASTLYRHFSTKEAIVLWDEHDAALDVALARTLSERAPFDALRTAFVEELGGRYDDDLDFQLRRVRFIYDTESIHAAAVEADFRDAAELTDALTSVLSKPNRRAAPILAGAAMLALDTAFDRWQQADGEVRLGELIDESFAHLARLASLD